MVREFTCTEKQAFKAKTKGEEEGREAQTEYPSASFSILQYPALISVQT